MITELNLYLDWYNIFRPHQGLQRQTPQEVFTSQPDIQPSTAPPSIPVLSVIYLKGRRHLPIVTLHEPA